MNESVRVKNIGLRGVTVADTRISFIDGEQGILIYRGFRIEDLAEHSTFEETSYLLLHDTLPGERELAAFSRQFVESRHLPDFTYESMRRWPTSTHP